MAWDNVPWAVGGGALHSPETGRLLAYVAFGGAEGVAQGTDLKVTALDVPTSKVRVSPGACSILSRAPGGSQQAYAGRLPTEDVVSISATGSSGGRSDLIVARVEDPFMAGEPWSDPADPTVGPYIFTRVISNVPNTAQTLADAGRPGDSAIPLARIDLPANTGTITDGMIVPLRRVAKPRSTTVHIRRDVGYGPNDTGAANYEYYSYPDLLPTTIPVPSWATSAVIRADLTGLTARNSAVAGYFRAALLGGTPTTTVVTLPTYFNEQIVGDTRLSYMVSSSIDIPSSLRGTTATVRTEFLRNAGSGNLRSDTVTQVVWDIEFIEGTA